MRPSNSMPKESPRLIDEGCNSSRYLWDQDLEGSIVLLLQIESKIGHLNATSTLGFSFRACCAV